MDFRFTEFDPRLARLEERIRLLQEIFQLLLLRTNGDVEEALRWLAMIGERNGLFDADLTLENFKKLLEQGGTIRRVAGGDFALSRKGERGLRTAALEAIFSNLRKGGAGDHRVAAAGSGHERLPETRPYEFGDPVAMMPVTRTAS